MKCDGCGKVVKLAKYKMVAYPGYVIRHWCSACSKGAEHCKA